jgi:hypothetical protein
MSEAKSIWAKYECGACHVLWELRLPPGFTAQSFGASKCPMCGDYRTQEKKS